MQKLIANRVEPTASVDPQSVHVVAVSSVFASAQLITKVAGRMTTVFEQEYRPTLRVEPPELEAGTINKVARNMSVARKAPSADRHECEFKNAKPTEMLRFVSVPCSFI